MNEENTLHFKITVDGKGLQDIETKSQAAFSGIAKGVKDLTSKSVDELQTISLELMEVVNKFNQLAKAVGVDPKQLRETLNYLREMRRESEQLEKAERLRIERAENAEAKLIRQQLANLEAEKRAQAKADDLVRRSNENQHRLKQAQITRDIQKINELATIEKQNIRYASKMKHDASSEFIRDIQAQNKQIKEQGDKAVAAFEKALGAKKKLGDGSFSKGAKNVFTGANNGVFSNILGGFGGGGRIGGSIASGLDGAMAGGNDGIGSALGGLAAGAGIGLAVAGLVGLVSIVKSATSAIFEFSKSAVKLAGDFEMTVNSIAVFSGGTSFARAELQLLQQTVTSTKGLSLEGAESGYRQLRALGFEAENSRKLIEGLGKIRITSGATEQSVERVIVNLTQLSASTARAGQDLKEIVHALPSMRGVFQDTFGTSESSKLKALIEKDGAEFFTKLADGMAKATSASGGLNTDLVDLENQWTLAKRAFGEPVLPMVTEWVKFLTFELKQNGHQFSELGVIVSNFYDALKGDNPKELWDALFSSPEEGTRIKRARDYKALTFEQYVKNETGQTVEQVKEYKSSLNDILDNERSYEAKKKMMNLNIGYNTYLNSKEDAVLDVERKRAAEIAEEDIGDARVNAMEKARVKALSSLQSSYNLQKTITDGYYQVLEARVNANVTYTAQQELEKARQLNQIKRESISSQVGDVTSFYDRSIALQAGNDDEIQELNIKKIEELKRLGIQRELLEINSQREIADAERKVLNERRLAAIEFTNVQVELVKFGYERTISEINRNLTKQTISIKDGYGALKSEAIRYFDETAKLMKERFALQLQDKTLSDSARLNLTQRMNLEEMNLEKSKSDKLLEIQDNREAAEESKRQKGFERLKAHYSAIGNLISGVAGAFFNPESFSSKSSEAFKDIFLGRGVIKDLKAAMKTRDNFKKNYEETSENSTLTEPIAIAKADFDRASAEVVRLQGNLASLTGTVTGTQREIDSLGDSLTKTYGSFKAFDDIAKKALDSQHRLEKASLGSEIDSINARLEVARNDYLDKISRNRVVLQFENKGLEVSNDTFSSAIKDSNLKEIQKIDDEIAKSKADANWLPKTDKIIELTGELVNAKVALKSLDMKQYAEDAELYANSIDGLSERLALLNSGDIGTVNGVLNGVAKSVLSERIAMATENIELEARIGLIGEDSASRYRNAWLKAIYDVKSASEDARESQIASQVQIANQTVFNADVAKAGIMEAMAGAKGYTEIFQDSFLSINASITQGISSLLKKATDGLGVFGDVLADIATQLLTMVTNRLMMKLLDMLIPSSQGVGGASGGGLGILGTILGGVLGNRAAGGTGTGVNLGAGGAGGGAVNSSVISSLIGSVIPEYARGGALASNGGFGVSDAFSSNSSISSSELISNSVGSLTSTAFRGGSSTMAQEALHSGGLLAGGGAAGLLKGLGAMAPMLGLSLGTGLGGQSIPGQLLGGIGGLAGGLALGIGTGAIGGGLTAGIGGATAAGLPIIGTMAATGILAAIAVPLLIGGYLFGRNKQRRKDEVTRTEYITDAFAKLDDILAKTKSHDISGSEAISAAEAVRESYREAASGLKSKKTRNIALKEIQDRINPRIEQIRAAAQMADKDKERFSDLELPEFATGGIVPGRFGEPRLVLAHGGEIIANPSQQTPAFIQASSDAGIPGVKGSAGNGGNSGNNPGNLHVELLLGTETQNQIFVNGAKSRQGYNVIIEQNSKKEKFRDTSSF